MDKNLVDSIRAVIKEELKPVTDDLDEIKEEIEKLKPIINDLEEIKEEIEELKPIIDDLKEIKEEIEELKPIINDLEEIKEELVIINKHIQYTWKDIGKFEKRIDKLEKGA